MKLEMPGLCHFKALGQPGSMKWKFYCPGTFPACPDCPAHGVCLTLVIVEKCKKYAQITPAYYIFTKIALIYQF